MQEESQVIDMDRHVIEPEQMWRDYLPKAYEKHAPTWTPSTAPTESLDERLARLGQRALLPVPPVLSVAGRPVWRGLSEVALIEMGVAASERRSALEQAQTAEGHLAHMDCSGVQMSVLLPTYAPYLVYDDEAPADLSCAYADAYNRWLADTCATAPQRLLGAALLSRSYPEGLVDELHRGLIAGHVAVVIRPEPVCGVHLSSPKYDRFWQACAVESVPVLIHGGTHARVSTAGAGRFATHFGQHMCSHPLEIMMALVALLEGGILARHPALRIGLLEGGSSWLPHWLGRLDNIWSYCRGELQGRINKPPSEYVREQCFVAIEPGEALLEETVKHLGPDRFVFGSDFPHLDHETQLASGLEKLRSSLGESARQVLWSNPLKLLSH